MVSSNHSFWCSGAASRTPQRRIWENSSSRACSNCVGVETLLGSERFLAMREGLLSFGRGAGSERRRNVTADLAPRKARRPSLASRGGGAGSSFRGLTAGRRLGFPDGGGTWEGGSMSDDKDQVYGPERAERLVALLRALAERIQELDRAGRLLDAAPDLQGCWVTCGASCFTTRCGPLTIRRRSPRAGASWRRPSGAGPSWRTAWRSRTATSPGGGRWASEGLLLRFGGGGDRRRRGPVVRGAAAGRVRSARLAHTRGRD